MPKVITVPQGEVEFEREHPMTLQKIKLKYDFKKFALECVQNYDFFGSGLTNILQGAEIVKLIEDCTETLEFGESNYDKFWKAVEARRWAQPAAQACIPFMVAVKDAKEKEEEKKEEGEKSK